jgi:hypothetical protein
MDSPGGSQSDPHREEQIENDEPENHAGGVNISVGEF